MVTRKNPTTRTAIYARFSSEAQAGGLSIELQLETCRRMAGTNPLEFIDRAQTGRTMQRDEFRKMLQAAERHEFTTLIVYQWSRFGRNAETHATIADLEDLGIRCISATEGEDYLSRGVNLLVADQFSKVLSQRVTASKHLRFKINKTFLGGKIAYGYSTVRGADELSRFVIDADEAAIVRQIFEFSNHESIGTRRIAQRLNAQGSKSRQGLDWGWTTINNILRNRMYTGQMSYGKRSEKLDRRTGKIKRINHAEYQTHQDENLRIISDADFEQVQARLRAHTARDYRIPNDVKPFSKRMKCGTCGSVMFCRHTTKRRKTVTNFLVCGRRDLHGLKPEMGCNNPNRPKEKELVAWIQDGIEKVMSNKDRIIERAIEIAGKSLDLNDGRRSKLEAELSQHNRQIQKFSDMLDGDLDEAETKGLLGQIGRLESKRDGVNAALRSLAGEASFDRRGLIKEVNAAFEEARAGILPVVTPAVFNRAVERFVGPLVALPSGEVVHGDTGVIENSAVLPEISSHGTTSISGSRR